MRFYSQWRWCLLFCFFFLLQLNSDNWMRRSTVEYCNCAHKCASRFLDPIWLPRHSLTLKEQFNFFGSDENIRTTLMSCYFNTLWFYQRLNQQAVMCSLLSFRWFLSDTDIFAALSLSLCLSKLTSSWQIWKIKQISGVVCTIFQNVELCL